MKGPLCPHCAQEMNDELAEEGICSECGKRFSETDFGNIDTENVGRENEEAGNEDEEGTEL